MQKLIDLSKKDTRIVVGLMSGTSVDGIDVVIVKITGNGENTSLDVLAFEEISYPEGFKDFVLKNSRVESADIEEISSLNFLIPQFYADAIAQTASKAGLQLSEIDLIGSHGQTIHHLPNNQKLFGKDVVSTLQIGSGSVLAKLTGIPVVSKFRDGDMALGGQGAPLVPYFDYIMFKHTDTSRALLNIGGISNLTYLKAGCTADEVMAFDCGPGNMLIDSLMKRFYGKEYDEGGKVAYSGKFNAQLSEYLFEIDTYVKQKPPKSTGREYYGEKFINEHILRFAEIPKEDIIHTISKYTAHAVYYNFALMDEGDLYTPTLPLNELFVSGGGAKNPFIMEQLQNHFGNDVKIATTDKLGVDADQKEAVCFAVLANEFISGNSANVPSVTGAKKLTSLGELALP
ncbi:MAG: anhydro-N-acetylmuramic acid kinase [Melioribacteraceae bacterium]|nr:MAG: anhydro-N-acetylmuramic acid kinase [Melioribacteraceae bacterium]